VTRTEIIAACQALVSRGTKPTLPEMRPIIAAWDAMPENGAGGALHCILEDGNRENSSLLWHIASPDNCDASKWICNVMLLLSRSQRRRL